MNDRTAPAAPAIIGWRAGAAAGTHAALPVIEGDFIAPNGKSCRRLSLPALGGGPRLLRHAHTSGAHHVLSGSNGYKLRTSSRNRGKSALPFAANQTGQAGLPQPERPSKARDREQRQLLPLVLQLAVQAQVQLVEVWLALRPGAQVRLNRWRCGLHLGLGASGSGSTAGGVACTSA